MKTKQWNRKNFFEKLEKLNIKIINTELKHSETISDLRAKYKTKLPDLICIWTAIEEWASIFMTNDRSLEKIEEMDFIFI